SGGDHRPLPPGDWRQWNAHRLRWWSECKRKTIAIGTRRDSHAVFSSRAKRLATQGKQRMRPRHAQAFPRHVLSRLYCGGRVAADGAALRFLSLMVRWLTTFLFPA